MDKRLESTSGPGGPPGLLASWPKRGGSAAQLIEHHFVGKRGEAICERCGCAAGEADVLCPASASLAREREKRFEIEKHKAAAEEHKAAAEEHKAAAEKHKAATGKWASIAALVAAAGLVGGVVMLSRQTPAAFDPLRSSGETVAVAVRSDIRGMGRDLRDGMIGAGGRVGGGLASAALLWMFGMKP